MSHQFINMLGMLTFVYAMYVGLEFIDSSFRVIHKRIKHRRDV